MKEDDSIWPQPDRVGRQELEIVSGDQHISFTTTKIGSLIDIKSSRCGWLWVSVLYLRGVQIVGNGVTYNLHWYTHESS